MKARERNKCPSPSRCAGEDVQNNAGRNLEETTRGKKCRTVFNAILGCTKFVYRLSLEIKNDFLLPDNEAFAFPIWFGPCSQRTIRRVQESMPWGHACDKEYVAGAAFFLPIRLAR